MPKKTPKLKLTPQERTAAKEIVPLFAAAVGSERQRWIKVLEIGNAVGLLPACNDCFCKAHQEIEEGIERVSGLACFYNNTEDKYADTRTQILTKANEVSSELLTAGNQPTTPENIERIILLLKDAERLTEDSHEARNEMEISVVNYIFFQLPKFIQDAIYKMENSIGDLVHKYSGSRWMSMYARYPVGLPENIEGFQEAVWDAFYSAVEAESPETPVDNTLYTQTVVKLLRTVSALPGEKQPEPGQKPAPVLVPEDEKPLPIHQSFVCHDKQTGEYQPLTADALIGLLQRVPPQTEVALAVGDGLTVEDGVFEPLYEVRATSVEEGEANDKAEKVTHVVLGSLNQ